MNANERTVADIMQREVATLNVDDRLDMADDLMSLGRIRHLPVLDGASLAGIVSQRDLLAASLTRALDFDRKERRSFLRAVEVNEVMTSEVVTVVEDTTLAEAATLLIERQIGCVPVVRGEGLVGLLTETDLLRAAYGHDAQSGEAPAADSVLDRDLDDLRRLRDELRLQIHLGAAEAKELWEDLEHSWRDVEVRARALARRAEEPLDGVVKGAENLVEEIRDGYRRIRELL